MGIVQPAVHMDISDTVDVNSTAAVAEAVAELLKPSFPGLNYSLLDQLFQDFEKLYFGQYPGFYGCEIRYHNHQHVLDVTLAMARLLVGFQKGQLEGAALVLNDSREQSGAVLTDAMVLIGMAAALFHDSGYIRRINDTEHDNGAAYTRVHVSRGASFLREYLPTIGLESAAEPCARLIHFTGYEMAPEDIPVADPTEALLGKLLGTADLLAQMADRDYVRKCRDDLYEEFVVGGMAGTDGDFTHTGTIYSSPDQLLRMTPGFIRNAIDERLDGYFQGVHHYAAAVFGGVHLYMDAIMENCRNLEAMLAAGADG